MRRIAFINEKGGTCKTTLCVNLGAWLARERGGRVLILDLDTQGHAGKSLGIDVRGMKPTAYELLVDRDVRVEDVARPTAIPGLEVVPANKDLARFPIEAAADPDRARRLAAKVGAALSSRYDYLLMDSPPSVSLVTENAMVATDEIVVPVALTYFALDGCAEVVASVERVRAEYGRPDLAISLIVPTLYRKTQLADAILERLRSRFPGEVSRTVLGFSVKIDEAQSHGQTIWEYAPRSTGATALEAIALELADRAPSARQAAAG